MTCLLSAFSRSAHCQLASAILISSGLGFFMPGCALKIGKQARQQVTPLRIENAYFLPDELIRNELVAAAKRGVKVEIIVPGKLIDQKLVRAASKRHWPELIEAGIKI
jgi:phosphatidylserine/phosphatidylglycerophosphate/cardiolipin synthase-like enzyme